MKRKTNLSSIPLLLGTALVLLVVACGGGQAVSLGPVGHTTKSTTPGTTPQPTAVSLTIWLARSDGVVPVQRAHAATPAVATAAIKALLAGPTAAERASGLSSAIPKGTKLLGISLHDRVATIDLTHEYASGGGTLSEYSRLAQVVYTLTEFPTIKKVRFHLDGAPLNVFTGDGIVLSHPVGRAEYINLLPPINVDGPTMGDQITSPVTVSGEANVFEANVGIEVLNRFGKVIGKTFTTASCGTGCRGTFSTQVAFNVTEEQPGTIVVHDDDAAGFGTPPHIVRIPVTLAP
ncbi:MAG: hypothetical protein QOG85_1642 [Gaiellaceae bacterium]|nr:hypothetical protein [Gaiellaceae bacterium]